MRDESTLCSQMATLLNNLLTSVSKHVFDGSIGPYKLTEYDYFLRFQHIFHRKKNLTET